MASIHPNIVVGLLAAVAVLAFACSGDSEPSIIPTPTAAPSATETAAAPDPPEGFRAVHFVDAQTGWVAGYSEADSGGVILATTDGGETWQRQYGAEGVSLVVNMTNTVNGTAVVTEYDGRRPIASTFLQTADGGKTWTPAPDGTKLASPCQSESGRRWRIEDDGVVLKSDDSGQSWNDSFTPPDNFRRLNGVQIECLGDDVVWISLHGEVASSNMTYAVYRTLDGGETWRPTLQHQAPELDVPDSGSQPGPIFIIDEAVAFFVNHCSACAMYQARLWRTTDGGATWDTPVEISDLLRARDVQFLDADRGWAVGPSYDGEALNYDGPAIILATTDGGQTWAQQYP